MKHSNAIRTSWTQALENNIAPCQDSLTEHLLEVHKRHPGFTEGCASKCKNAAGQTSYEWLCDVLKPDQHRHVLDLACGSGLLLELCHDILPQNSSLSGIDLSPAELAIAKERLIGKNITLHKGLAQNLSFAEADSFDAALCHWALTLMDPIEPVLEEIDRVLSNNGVFAAIVDGDLDAAPGYTDINEIVFKHVTNEVQNYGDRDLGDPRTRNPKSLHSLVSSVFDKAQIDVETSVFTLRGNATAVAHEAVGFFYAAFILPPPKRAILIDELTDFLNSRSSGETSYFSMPVCRLRVLRK
ncbi:MAG: class I SAM-dependent methyltransferase [Pseudomonadota bacterium]